MLDIRKIREQYEEVKKLLEMRGKGDYGLPRVAELDRDRRDILVKVEKMKNDQKLTSKKIPEMKKKGEDTTELMNEMKQLSEDIKSLDQQVSVIEVELHEILMGIPNTPNPETPIGNTDEDNLEIRKWGEPTAFDHEIKAHWDLGSDLDILDFERATKIAGARFTVYKGLGAKT